MLGLALSEQQRIRFSIDSGFVNIDVPKHEKDRYFVEADELWTRWKRPEQGLAVPLGEDRMGNVATLNFSHSNSPHLLIGGTTGSGKSEALMPLLRGLTQHYDSKELRLLLVDPKGTELRPFEDDSHLEGTIGWEEQDALKLLKRAVDEMQDRYALFRKDAGKAHSLPEYNKNREENERISWWVIVLDEYADLTSDSDAKREIESLLKRLA